MLDSNPKHSLQEQIDLYKFKSKRVIFSLWALSENISCVSIKTAKNELRLAYGSASDFDKTKQNKSAPDYLFAFYTLDPHNIETAWNWLIAEISEKHTHYKSHTYYEDLLPDLSFSNISDATSERIVVAKSERALASIIYRLLDNGGFYELEPEQKKSSLLQGSKNFRGSVVGSQGPRCGSGGGGSYVTTDGSGVGVASIVHDIPEKKVLVKANLHALVVCLNKAKSREMQLNPLTEELSVENETRMNTKQLHGNNPYTKWPPERTTKQNEKKSLLEKTTAEPPTQQGCGCCTIL